MNYKGYVGQVTFDDEANIFHGEIINTRDVITFQGKSVDEIREAFKDSVDEYLEWCKEEGELPDKPFSGKFVVRISPDLHRSIVCSAKKEGKSLNRWVEEHFLATMPVSSNYQTYGHK
jgi:predicted HicB family RNase H-like nuclease